jgi:DNA primase
MEIREIKSRLSILTILSHYGLKPDKNDFILCPFHDDHNPSLKIYTKTNTFHCFGCGATGDVIEFIQLKEASTGSACTKHESIIKAAQMVNPNYKLNIKSMENIQTPQELSRSAILMKYLQSCKAGMEHSKAAREYAESRKLNVAKLGIGFNGARMFDTWKKRQRQLYSPFQKLSGI